MAQIKCAACEDKFGQSPLAPCAVCQHWLDKLTGGRTTEAEVIAELVAENKVLNLELQDFKAKQTAEKGKEA